MAAASATSAFATAKTLISTPPPADAASALAHAQAATTTSDNACTRIRAALAEVEAALSVSQKQAPDTSAVDAATAAYAAAAAARQQAQEEAEASCPEVVAAASKRASVAPGMSALHLRASAMGRMVSGGASDAAERRLRAARQALAAAQAKLEKLRSPEEWAWWHDAPPAARSFCEEGCEDIPDEPSEAAKSLVMSAVCVRGLDFNKESVRRSTHIAKAKEAQAKLDAAAAEDREVAMKLAKFCVATPGKDWSGKFAWDMEVAARTREHYTRVFDAEAEIKKARAGVKAAEEALETHKTNAATWRRSLEQVQAAIKSASEEEAKADEEEDSHASSSSSSSSSAKGIADRFRAAVKAEAEALQALTEAQRSSSAQSDSIAELQASRDELKSRLAEAEAMARRARKLLVAAAKA